MKKCPHCGAEYPENAVECAIDQTPLVDAAPDVKPGSAALSAEVESDVPPDGEAELCTCCLFPNVPGSRWCKRCGAPMSYFTGILMPDGAEAFGFVLGRAIEKPSNLTIVILVWMYFFPNFILNALSFALILLGGNRGFWGFLSFLLVNFHLAISGTALFRITKNYRRRESTGSVEVAG